MTSDAIDAQLARSRQELLDLGLRNPLLNHRPSRRRGLEVIDERSDEVYRILVEEARSMSFQALPAALEEQTTDGVLDSSVLLQHDDDGEVADRHRDRLLQTPYAAATLERRLLATARDAELCLQETGANICYLALGMLHWIDDGEQPRRAPLVLIPLAIERSSARSRFRIRHDGGDIGHNSSLQAKLQAEFAIDLPTADDEETPSAYAARVAAAIDGRPGWQVAADEICCGFFNFTRGRMHLDLDPQAWPGDRQPADHPLIAGLLGAGLPNREATIAPEEDIDRHRPPESTCEVMPADASQAAALADIAAGHDLVIQGPPGTGKSQTICNAIAEAVAAGKRVLFVSEKLAALEVVHRRLAAIGLADCCLELHSHKAGKRAVLDELGRCLSLGRPLVTEDTSFQADSRSARAALDAHRQALTTPIGVSGLSPIDAMGILLGLRSVDERLPRLDPTAIADLDAEAYATRQEAVAAYARAVATTGQPGNHPFDGCRLRQLLPSDSEAIDRLLAAAITASDRLARRWQDCLRELAISEADDSPAALATLCQLASAAQAAPDLRDIDTGHASWRSGQELDELIEALRDRQAEAAELAQTLIPEAYDLDSQDLLTWRQGLIAHQQTWRLWRWLMPSWRRATAGLARISRSGLSGGPTEWLRWIDHLLAWQRCQRALADHQADLRGRYGDRWRDMRSPCTELAGIGAWLRGWEQTAAGLPACSSLPADAPRLATLARHAAGLQEAHQAWRESLDQVAERLDDHGSPQLGGLAHLGALLAQRRQALPGLGAWCHLQSAIAALDDSGLADLAAAFHDRDDAPDHALQALDRCRASLLLDRAYEERPALANATAADLAHQRQRFATADALTRSWMRGQVLLQHWQQLPGPQAAGQVAILRHECAKKSRHLPLRELFARAGRAVQACKPVFMMSPLSVATYCAPDAIDFDLLLVDEASQVRPVDAFGALLRCRQAVVVGDSRQLPPTGFFERMASGDEHDDESLTGDVESILGLFAARGAQHRMLRWHYRSRHPSLISCANRLSYDDRLIVAPAPDRGRQRLGLQLHHLPETVYDRGASRCNAAEAEAVAAAVLAHAADHRDRSLGVAAFSRAQAEAIADRIERLRRAHPEHEAFFAPDRPEPVFVKNLENVQGDERDVILISVGYGRDAEGRLSYNFGPLNADGGERRLNVLMTRARQRCVIFSNFTHHDLDPQRSQALGLRHLAAFLAHAAADQEPAGESVASSDAGPFVAAMSTMLADAGAAVATGIGGHGCHIDLALADDADPSRFRLGVCCSGLTTGRSTRDRELLHRQVLRGLGWAIHDCCPSAWFADPAAGTAAILAGQTGDDPLAPPCPVCPRDDDQGPPGLPAPAPYRAVEPPPGLADHDLVSASEEEIAGWITAIVAAEGPIHRALVCRRLIEYSPASRSGPRIDAAINNGVALAIDRAAIIADDDFLALPDQPAIALRDRSQIQETQRKLEWIPPIEIDDAIQRALSEGYSMTDDELHLVVARLLGYQRGGERINQAIDSALAAGLEAGRWRRDQRGEWRLQSPTPGNQPCRPSPSSVG